MATIFYYPPDSPIANTTLSQYLRDNPQNLYIVAYDEDVDSISLLSKENINITIIDSIPPIYISWETNYESPCYYKIFIIDNYLTIMETRLLKHDASIGGGMCIPTENNDAEKRMDSWITSMLSLQNVGDLQDSNDIIYIKDRKILFNEDKNYYTLINEDNVSEVLTFRMNRFYEGVDLSEKDIYFYCNPVSLGKDNYIKLLASNVVLVKDSILTTYEGFEENAVEMQLVINNLITDEPGPVPFAIMAEGPAPSTYLWQTYPATLQVDQGVIKPNLKVSDYKPLDYNAWQKSVEERLSEQNTWYSLEEITAEEA